LGFKVGESNIGEAGDLKIVCEAINRFRGDGGRGTRFSELEGIRYDVRASTSFAVLIVDASFEGLTKRCEGNLSGTKPAKESKVRLITVLNNPNGLVEESRGFESLVGRLVCLGELVGLLV